LTDTFTDPSVDRGWPAPLTHDECPHVRCHVCRVDGRHAAKPRNPGASRWTGSQDPAGHCAHDARARVPGPL